MATTNKNVQIDAGELVTAPAFRGCHRPPAITNVDLGVFVFVEERAMNDRKPIGNIMTPGHPQWEEFCKRLGGPEGCNFREDERGKTIWTCNGSTARPFATAILEDMKADIPASLAYFSQWGGHCDCEILFNVDIETA